MIHSKIEQEVQRFPIYSLHPPPPTPSLPHYLHLPPCPLQSGTFVRIRELMGVHHCHLHLVVDIRAPSGCRAGFGQMYNECSPLQLYGIASLLQLCLSPHPPAPGDRSSFYCLHCLAFSRTSYGENHTVCSLFTLALVTGI